ncbi:MAG: protoporphyrinogen/coproporphyrinogen oxidase [Dehalococcoidia bacterium]
MRVVIIGAGPTGLGAGYRLRELGHDDWQIYEASDHVGGLAASVTSPNGFVYDTGGHVMFSRYAYFHELVDRLLGADYTRIERESWIWMQQRWVPYPFQNNIKFLDPESVLECLLGLAASRGDAADARNFGEWMLATFGEGITRLFMRPYNFKVWAHPAEMMSKDWIAERVSVVGLESALRNVILDRQDSSWGPNNSFKFPLYGGTGGLYERFHPYVDDHLSLNKRAAAIDPVARVVRFEDGDETTYDVLLSTMPLTQLSRIVDGAPDEVRRAADDLCWNSGLFVGVGVRREEPTDKCWVYVPEEDAPFYRVTYLSRYSPHMAPPGHFCLVTETSRSAYKPVDATTIVDQTIEGLIAAQILSEQDRGLIVDRTLIDVPMAYPIPTLGRDRALSAMQPWLMERDIFSRGRFGAWLYEIGNMDHSIMQGVEFADHVLNGAPETVWVPSDERALAGAPA